MEFPKIYFLTNLSNGEKTYLCLTQPYIIQLSKKLVLVIHVEANLTR